MIIGISKERLQQLKDRINGRFDSGTPTHNVYSLVLDRLISECAELDPWLPIESAPKDIPVWLFNGVKCLAQWDYRSNAWHVMVAISKDRCSYNRELDFTHYKELHPDPICDNSSDT